jgi:hypothetical protein
MPIAATPFGQAGELALATKWTGEPGELPFDGEETLTPANPGTAQNAKKHTIAENFPDIIPTSPASNWFC